MAWRVALSALLAAALVSTASVTAAAAEREGPPIKRGDTGPAVVEAHKRLAWLGYSISKEERKAQTFGKSSAKAIKSFQRKFFMSVTGEVNRRTWTKITTVSGKVGKLPKACRTSGVVLCIDKTSKLLRYVDKGKVIKTVDVRFGVPGLDTPTGTYRVSYKSRYATSGINGPNRPRVSMPYALFYQGDIAVHYSYSFADHGYYPGGGSHGCVNVRDRAAMAWIFRKTKELTKVHVYRS